ncbi:tetratricopeptide repeat protein [Flavobacterium sp.]|uniref:tetratricopeptide repeat-containing sensor histidine kinase n=1 Tax=Flavobacterium sp. TaxID=239 RepID=UPI0039E4C604
MKTIVANTKVHDTTRLANISLLLDNLYESKDTYPYTRLMGQIAQKNLSRKNDPTLHRAYTIYLAAYYNNISILLEDKADARSLDYLNKSIALYKSVGDNDEVYSSTVSKGLLLSRRKRYKEAIDCYYQALKYFEQNPQKNAEDISYVYSNIGVIYGEQGQDKIAINYLKKAIFYIDKKVEKTTVEDELRKATFYYNIGAKYILLKDYDKAVDNLNTSLELSGKHNHNAFKSFALVKLGVIDLHFKRIDAAEEKLLKAIAIADTEHSKAITLVNLGNVYFEKGAYEKAENNLKKGLQISKGIKNNDLKELAYHLLYKVYKAKGNYKESVEMLESYNTIKDSAKVEETKNELKRQELKYDYEKKELKYKLDSQRKTAAKNNLLIGLCSALLLLLVGSYFLYRSYRQKQAISTFEKNELNQKLLLTQMNPHFIFNSIDNIQSLIYNKREKEAVNYLTKFSRLTRQILENSNENYISLAEELLMMENYLSIQQLLYNNKFDFKIEVEEAIDVETIQLPPMLTQPFLENAIKHGLRDVTENGLLAIRFYLKEKHLYFEITDNGVGFPAIDQTKGTKSLAMKITKERLVNLIGKTNFEVRAENLLDANGNTIGAKVSFEIPYIY